jgi:hypothetical protein
MRWTSRRQRAGQTLACARLPLDCHWTVTGLQCGHCALQSPTQQRGMGSRVVRNGLGARDRLTLHRGMCMGRWRRASSIIDWSRFIFCRGASVLIQCSAGAQILRVSCAEGAFGLSSAGCRPARGKWGSVRRAARCVATALLYAPQGAVRSK